MKGQPNTMPMGGSKGFGSKKARIAKTNGLTMGPSKAKPMAGKQIWASGDLGKIKKGKTIC